MHKEAITATQKVDNDMLGITKPAKFNPEILIHKAEISPSNYVF